MTPAERKLRKQLQQKRIEVLGKISEITKQNCTSCTIVERYSAKDCAECKTFKKINELGKELTAIAKSKPRVKSKLISESPSKLSVTKDKLVNFPVESYKQMKKNGKQDKHIILHLGVSKSVFYEWKLRHGLVTKKKLTNFTEEEYLKLKSEGLSKADIAKKFDVSTDSIYKWVKRNIKQV